jgi:glycosyltransferase involved in cell wall biosynthesis
MPRVTVITAAYNAAEYLAETIESVLAQTYSDFEYIVVDDGSDDATPDIIAEYASRIVSLRQPNAGEGAARNRGFEIATGEYVAIVDADDVWAQEKLECQVLAMESQPDAGLCYTNGSSIRADGSVLEAVLVPPHSRLTCLRAMTGQNPLVTSSVMYRRRFLEARPYRSLPVAADFYVHLKVLWRACEQSVFVDEPLVRYRVVETSVLRQVDAWERGRLTLKAVEAFIDDMRSEKPVPQDLQRRGVAYSRFLWAWYCIDGRTRYRFAIGQLVWAVRDDPRLAWRAGRQVAKLTRNALLGARGS